jgi:ATP-dependent RNA helicase DDX56/DBP9
MSATLSPELQKLKHVVLHSPAVLKLEEEEEDGYNTTNPATLTEGTLMQFYLNVPTKDRYLVLYVFLKLGLLKGKGLFFVNTIDGGYRLKLFLEQFHIRSAVLNAELPLKSRLNIIEHFNVGNFDYLIATDDATDRRGGSSATQQGNEGDEKKSKKGGNKSNNKRKQRDGEYGVSRGLDFRGVSFVVNVDLPSSTDSYTHRIGRTARGGANGVALTLIDSSKREECEMLAMIQESQPTKSAEVGGNGDGELKHVTAGGDGGNGEAIVGMHPQVQRQPCPLDFDLKEIEGFRYRVEDGKWKVYCLPWTSVKIRHAKTQLCYLHMQ